MLLAYNKISYSAQRSLKKDKVTCKSILQLQIQLYTMNEVLLASLLLVAITARIASTQQCRQVTVCDDEVSSSIKGQKGEVGGRGKAGPSAVKGSKGESGTNGEKGSQGESCALGSLGTEIMKKLTDAEEILTLLRKRSAPTSCAASSVNGTQVLLSGEEIYCEDGWTVLQRRFDGSVDFQLHWNQYKNGFGSFNGEFWLGLDKIHRLTSGGNCRLRVDLRDFDDDEAYAEYSSFSVDDESELYRLHVTGYSGTAGDALRHHNNKPFTSIDNDNDENSSGNCATVFGGSGGWWFHNCFQSALNAVWGRSGGNAHNIIWHAWKGYSESLKATTMKLRCD